MLLQYINKLRIKFEKSHGRSATQSDCSGISIAITHTAKMLGTTMLNKPTFLVGERFKRGSWNLRKLLSITRVRSSLKTQKHSSNMQIAKKKETMPPFFHLNLLNGSNTESDEISEAINNQFKKIFTGKNNAELFFLMIFQRLWFFFNGFQPIFQRLYSLMRTWAKIYIQHTNLFKALGPDNCILRCWNIWQFCWHSQCSC